MFQRKKSQGLRLAIVLWLGISLVTSVSVGVAGAPSMSSLASLVKQLRHLLAGIPGVDTKDYLLANFVLSASGDEIESAVNDYIKKATNDGKVKSLAGHLKSIHETSELALKEVSRINEKMLDFPDHSKQEDYCAQVNASADKIRRIEEGIKHLEDLRLVAEAYLKALPILEQMAVVLRDFWLKIDSLAVTFDIFSGEGTYGTMTEQYFYWTEGAVCPELECAQILIAESRENLKKVVSVARDKVTKIESVLKSRKAYHAHFYSTSETKCKQKTKDMTVASPFSNSVPLGLGGKGGCPDNVTWQGNSVPVEQVIREAGGVDQAISINRAQLRWWEEMDREARYTYQEAARYKDQLIESSKLTIDMATSYSLQRVKATLSALECRKRTVPAQARSRSVSKGEQLASPYGVASPYGDGATTRYTSPYGNGGTTTPLSGGASTETRKFNQALLACEKSAHVGRCMEEKWMGVSPQDPNNSCNFYRNQIQDSLAGIRKSEADLHDYQRRLKNRGPFDDEYSLKGNIKTTQGSIIDGQKRIAKSREEANVHGCAL